MKQEGRITDVVISGVDLNDHPDYSDAYVESANIDGVPMDEDQLDKLSANHDLIYEWIHFNI